MDNHINLLITLSDGRQLLRVAFRANAEVFEAEETKRHFEETGILRYPLEPENKAFIKSLLPLHVQSCGEIVEVSELFEVVNI